MTNLSLESAWLRSISKREKKENINLLYAGVHFASVDVRIVSKEYFVTKTGREEKNACNETKIGIWWLNFFVEVIQRILGRSHHYQKRFVSYTVIVFHTVEVYFPISIVFVYKMIKTQQWRMEKSNTQTESNKKKHICAAHVITFCKLHHSSQFSPASQYPVTTAQYPQAVQYPAPYQY